MSFLPLAQTKLVGDLVNKFSISVEGGSFPILLISLYAGIWALTRILGSVQTHLDQIWTISVSNGLEQDYKGGWILTSNGRQLSGVPLEKINE